MSFLIASGHIEVEAKTDAAKSKITALVGAMGALGPTAGAAGAAVASAGAGLAAFGLAAGKQIADLKKASDAQSKYQDAVRQSGKSSQEAIKAEKAYQQTLSGMPKATREATAAFSGLKDSYDQWSDSLASDTMPVFTKSFQLFSALLPKTSGLVKGTSAELDRLVTLIAGGVASPGFDRFMASLTDFSTSTLHSMTNGLLNLSQSLGSFASGGGFDDFIATAKEVGPLLGETLANVAEALLNLTAAGGQVGISLLTAANALAELVNAVPPEVIGTLLQLYAAFKLVKLGAAGVAAVTGSAAAANLANFTRAARFGGVGSAIAGVTQRMSTMGKVAGGLGILGAVALGINALAEKARGAPPDVDRLTTSLKTLVTTGQFTGELKNTFGSMDGVTAKFRSLHGATKAMEDVKPWLQMMPMGLAIEKLTPKVDDLINGDASMTALTEDFKSTDQALAQLAAGGNAKEAAAGFDMYAEALRKGGASTKQISALFPAYMSAVAGLKAEQAIAAAGMGLFGQQAVATKTKLDAQKQSTDGLKQSLIALNQVQRDGLGAMNSFEQSIDDTAKAAKENAGALTMSKGKLDLNSQGARNAEAALRDLATRTDDAATKTRESTGSWQEAMVVYRRGRGEFVANAREMGLTAQQANFLADQIMRIPSKKSTKFDMRTEDAVTGLNSVIGAMKKTPNAKSVTVRALTKDAVGLLEQLGFKVQRMKDGQFKVIAQTGTARSNLAGVQAARDGLKSKNITVGANVGSFWSGVRGLVGRVLGTSYINVAYRKADATASPRFASGGRIPRLAGGGDVQGFPHGGYVDGPGTATSDSILGLMGSGAAAMVSDTEYVMRAAAVAKYGVGFMDAVNTGRLSLPGYAKGGKLTAKQKAAAEKRKQAAAEEKRRQSEGKKALTSDTTFTTGGRLAGYKYTETVHDLGMPDSVGALVTSINTYMSNIKKAFTGKTEAYLVGKLTSSGKALLANQKKLEAVNKSLDSAKSNLDDLKGKFDSLKNSVSSSLVGFGNITKIGKYGTSADTLIKQLQSDTSRTTEFSKQLEALKGKGLNAAAIADIAQAGVTGGGMNTAQSLLNATPEQIARINELQGQLQKASDAAGNTAASAMYGAGLKAAEGLVKGLTAQQKAIEATMMNIAKSMEKAIKKALGIKSPSKVMEPIGDFAFQGVEQGWIKRAAAGRTPISGSVPTFAKGAPSPSVAAGPSIVVNLNPVFNTMTLPSPAERKAFAVGMAKDINDALRTYQRERRVSR